MWLQWCLHSSKGDVPIIGCNLATQVAFKNCTPFTKPIPKIDWTKTDDAEDLDLVRLIYNLSDTSLIIIKRERERESL